MRDDKPTSRPPARTARPTVTAPSHHSDLLGFQERLERTQQLGVGHAPAGQDHQAAGRVVRGGGVDVT